MLGDEVVILFSEDVFGFKNFAELFVKCDVAEIPVFDEVNESGEVVEDGGEVVFDLMFREELRVLH